MTWISPEDARWARLLERVPHDAYHLPSYVAVAARHERGEPCAFLLERDGAAILVPLVLREVPGGGLDATSPYGHPAPLFLGEPSSGLVAAFVEACRERRLASVFVRLHPLLPSCEAYRRHGDVVEHGPTVHVVLDAPPEELDRRVRKGHRRDVRRLLDAGYTVSHDRWEQLGDFVALYDETMQHVGAAGYYRFPRSYFEGLREALGPRLRLSCAHDARGDVAAAQLTSMVGPFAQALFAGTSDRHRPDAPAKLIDVAVRDRAREEGCRFFNLGGGLGAREDSLFHYKAGFSPARGTFATWRVVPDPLLYDALVEREGARGATDFFPLYRARERSTT